MPTLIGYGLIDHCVPQNQKHLLMDEFEKYDVPYEYIAFPKSNHGMYNDLDKTQEFMDKTLKYCEYYLKNRRGKRGKRSIVSLFSKNTIKI